MSIFFTGLSAQFWQAYGQAAPFWAQVAMLKPSNTEIEKDGWMGKIPTLREWIGPRVVQNAAARSYTLENRLWELTLAVDKFKIQDDTYGVYAPIVAYMGMQSAKWPDYMIADAMRLNSRLAFDGLAYYHASHPVDVDDAGKGTYSNTKTLALTPDNFQSVRKDMMKFVAEDGRPLGLSPDLLVVPPSLEITALNILNAAFIAPQLIGGNTQVGANENVLKGVSRLLVVPELETTIAGIDGTPGLGSGDPDPAKTWFIFDTRKPIKSHMFQQRQAPVFVPRVDPTDPVVFNEHQFVYGVEARGNVGVTLPWLSVRSVGGTLA
jgi:phage major head subunit gpT-like protein